MNIRRMGCTRYVMGKGGMDLGQVGLPRGLMGERSRDVLCCGRGMGKHDFELYLQYEHWSPMLSP